MKISSWLSYIAGLCMFVGAILGFYSCSNDFVLAEPSSDVAVVYGVISVNDTANYVRVERAFIDDKTSALVLSKDINQLYFSDIAVTMTNTKTNKSYELKRVDGNEEGYKRDQGAFADAPNYLYKLPSSIHVPVGGDTYKIRIAKGDLIISEGTTKILKRYMDTDLTPSASNPNLSFPIPGNLAINWRNDADAVIHDLTLIFNYREFVNGVETDKSVNWSMVKNYVNPDLSAGNRANIPGINFYSFLKGAIPADPNVKRVFKDIDIILSSGGKEIKDYISIGQANLGITSSGEIPVYSNMSNGGVGIFSSKSQLLRENMLLATRSLDSLRRGSITKDLNFQ